MSDWTVTVTLPDDGSLTPADMIALAEDLDKFDAYVSRPRDGRIDVRLYVEHDDPMEATAIAYGAVVDRFDRQPIGVETLTEDEFARRAELPTLPELMSAAEIADELGVSRQRVHKLRETAAFPAPLAELRGGAVWDALAVRKFARDWDRKPGRPRTPDIVIQHAGRAVVIEAKTHPLDKPIRKVAAAKHPIDNPVVRKTAAKHRHRPSTIAAAGDRSRLR